MKSLKNIKKIAAIVGGVALLGAGLAFAGPLTYQNVPIINNAGQPVVQVVVGSQAQISDGIAAGNIAAAIGNLAYTSVPVTATVDSASLSGLHVTSTTPTSVSNPTYSLSNQQVWLNETGVTTATGGSYIFSALIGSVLNQGVQLGSPQYTKTLQTNTNYAFKRNDSITTTDSPYYAAGSVPTGGIVPQTNSNSNDNSGGGVNFNTFTPAGSPSYDNLLQITSSQFSALLNNWGANGESESLFLSGFPVFDQANSGAVQNQFALLGAGGAYQVSFSNPILNTTSTGGTNLNSPISLFGQQYSIINATGVENVVSGSTVANGGKITLASSLSALQTVYVGKNLTSGPWTVQLQDLAQTNQGTNDAAAVAVFYNKNLTNETSINAGMTSKFNVSGNLLYLNVNSTFAGLYAYQKWAKMQLYSGVYKLQDGKEFNTTNDKGWYVDLLWTNTTSGSKGNALKDIIVYNYTPTQLTTGQSFSFIQDPAAYKLTFVGDTLGNNYDTVTASLSTPSATYQNTGTGAGVSKEAPTNITEPAEELTVQSNINNAFDYGGQSSSSITYDLTPYQLSYSGNAGGGPYASNIVLSYTGPDAATLVSASAPLYVQVRGYTSPTATSAQTEPQVEFTSPTQTVPLTFGLYNVTDITLQNGRSLPTGSGTFSISVLGASSTLSTLNEVSPVVLLNPSNGNNYNLTESGYGGTINYNQQNGQQAPIVLTAGSGALNNNVRQYYTFQIGEQSVPQNSIALDYLGFGIYNTTQSQSQSQILQMNYSMNGQHNNATYVSTQGYTIPVQTGFRTEKGSKVVSISPTSDTFDMAKSIDQLQFELSTSSTDITNANGITYSTFGPYSIGQTTNLGNVTIAKINATIALTNSSIVAGTAPTYTITGQSNLTATPSVTSATTPTLLTNLGSTSPLVVADVNADQGMSLVLVGSGFVNTLSATLQQQYNVSFTANSPTISGQAYGTNRILVAGYSAAQTTQAADSFIAQLYASAASST